MNLEKQCEVFEETVEEMRTIMFKKGNDYANSDRLSNFKLAGNISGGNAKTNCLNLIATKVARLGVLLNSMAAPNNESISDSLVDMANYAILLKMILLDENPRGALDVDGQPYTANIFDTAAAFLHDSMYARPRQGTITGLTFDGLDTPPSPNNVFNGTEFVSPDTTDPIRKAQIATQTEIASEGWGKGRVTRREGDKLVFDKPRTVDFPGGRWCDAERATQEAAVELLTKKPSTTPAP